MKSTNIRKHTINIIAGQINKYWRCNIVGPIKDESKKKKKEYKIQERK
jgi:hypothetical protein